MATFAFAGGVLPLPAYGQRDKVRFVGTWANGDTWTIDGVSTLEGDFTLGKGNIAGQTYTNGLVFRGRVYISFADNFALSANAEPTLWEKQNPGAGVINFNSQYGTQDTVAAFATMQGRLAVFGRQSIQLWNVDADPANFALVQALDNSGTTYPLSVQSLGDEDVLYLDSSGIRSLKARELTLNAEVNDIGTAVDLLVKTAVLNNSGTICAAVEPSQRQYWCFINGSIFVLSKFTGSKIIAWSTYLPTVQYPRLLPNTPAYQNDGFGGAFADYYPLEIGSTYFWTKGIHETSLTNGVTTYTNSGSFVATDAHGYLVGTAIGASITSILKKTATVGSSVVPKETFSILKMVVSGGFLYLLDSNGWVYKYGATTEAASYDTTQPTVELPYYDLKDPSLMKQGMAIRVALSGQWTISAGMNPIVDSPTTIGVFGNTGTPDMNTDSTFDVGTIAYNANGSHFKMRFVGDPTQAIAKKMKIGKITFEYQVTNRQ